MKVGLKKHPSQVLFSMLTDFGGAALSRKVLSRQRLACGLVGAGHFVRFAYLPALKRRRVPLYVPGIFSRSEENIRKVVSGLRSKVAVFHSYDELLDSEIPAVIIAAPNHLHSEYVHRALLKDKDVLCEKPLANNLSDAWQLKGLLEKTDRVLMIGFNERYLDRMQRIKFFLEQGCLTQIREVRAYHNQDLGRHLRQSDWLSDRRKSGGGVLHNAGVHLINVMLYLFGEVLRVEAKLENLELPETFGEDTATCRLFFKSGVVGSLLASYVNRVPSGYEHMVITGKEGVITTDMLKSDIQYSPGKKGRPQRVPCRTETMEDSVFNELTHFCECVRERRVPRTDIDDAIATMKVIRAAYRSSQEGREIFLDAVE